LLTFAPLPFSFTQPLKNAFYQWLKGQRLPRQNMIFVAIDAAWQSQLSMVDTPEQRVAIVNGACSLPHDCVAGTVCRRGRYRPAYRTLSRLHLGKV
jgi:hypothetical protein